MGMNKGLCVLHDERFIQLLINELEILFKDMVLVASIEEYDVFEIEKIEDIIPDKGPIGGIYTALNKSETEDNIIVSCDIPLISSDVLKLLVEDKSNADVVQLATKSKNMPLIARYKKKLEPFFLEKIKNNDLKLNKVLKELNVKTIVVSEEQEKQLQNINTPIELKKIQNES
ncbi:molybdenum cofactor guanylyltransferase [Flavobacteriaceae bacterium UJ101]|nr:molybdenum cofactor guanylyltransferase [Flavobacteriaceae bacterium UJ101]